MTYECDTVVLGWVIDRDALVILVRDPRTGRLVKAPCNILVKWVVYE